jgi:hypothetical protein
VLHREGAANCKALARNQVLRAVIGQGLRSIDHGRQAIAPPQSARQGPHDRQFAR